jgi:CRP/FNR family cyclic AMP-dependent transcriptional regulator
VQGDIATNVLYIQKGRAKFTVVNPLGKEIVITIFRSGEFFGEGVLAGQTSRIGSATSIEPTTVLVLERTEMERALHADDLLSDSFITYIVSRNLRVEADLMDQIFNSTEKRLARSLLLLARYGMEGPAKPVLDKISPKTFAEMSGTTRSRVNRFLNKFRILGFIDYNGGIPVQKSLLGVVLHK